MISLVSGSTGPKYLAFCWLRKRVHMNDAYDYGCLSYHNYRNADGKEGLFCFVVEEIYSEKAAE